MERGSTLPPALTYSVLWGQVIYVSLHAGVPIQECLWYVNVISFLAAVPMNDDSLGMWNRARHF